MIEIGRSEEVPAGLFAAAVLPPLVGLIRDGPDAAARRACSMLLDVVRSDDRRDALVAAGAVGPLLALKARCAESPATADVAYHAHCVLQAIDDGYDRSEVGSNGSDDTDAPAAAVSAKQPRSSKHFSMVVRPSGLHS